MSIKVVDEQEFRLFIEKLASAYEVVAPVKKRGEHVFKRIFDVGEVDLEYVTTILPPKKYLLPPSDGLIKLKKNGEFEEVKPEAQRRVLLGVHSCDLNALMILDRVFLDHFKLPQYVERRRSLLTVALTCLNPSPTCFCASMGTGPSPDQGYDLLITKISAGYLLEVGSENGEGLIRIASGRQGGKKDLEEKSKLIGEALKLFKKKIDDVSGLPELFERNLEHDVWKKLGEIDLACGQCVMSCPTCYCFDVSDQLSLDGSESIRVKEWDACFTLEFSEVALGGNFRRDRAARLRQFIGHNLGWGGGVQYPELGGRTKCVGCGRCIRVCPVHIDLTEVVKTLRSG
ncbi:MAG: 4Fe-4S dicluster domain-containing protein [Candidatus Bathyarchaeia archaeon]